MRYFILFLTALILSHASRAAEPVPGDACGAAGATMASNNSGIGHFMLCQGGTWKAVYSYNATGALTKIGNLSCASGEILKWNGTTWACAADGGADNLGNHTATATLNMNAQAISGAATISATGKISTTGIVKVGTQAACAAADAGSMRYAGGSAPWEYCDGGGTWRPFRQPRCQNDGAGECYLASPRSGDDPEFASANIRCGINILGVSGTFGTGAPNAFSFTDVTGAAVSTLITASPVTISGIPAGCSGLMGVSGQGSPQISVNGGAWGTSASISNGDTLAVRLTSSGSPSTTLSAAVNIGGVTDTWSVTTGWCGGKLIGGYCWYYGIAGDSCDAACAPHGGCDLTGTKDYAGSAGTDANCEGVLYALTGQSYTVAGGAYTLGCIIGNAGVPRRTTLTTSCSSSLSNTNRACACNN